ncbi:unnamed protein product [Cuscuta epithymum]|uniref:Uncharacterized protein n=1 Tax=Cuscuta epithymum TaxID=186058 RepID=A0AAV0EZG5_9ASTE|nr:unnamed protein product [Cuscuta epithymum]
MIRSPIQLTKPMFEIEIPKKWSYVLLKTKVSTCVSILPSAAVSSPRKSFHYFQFAIKVVLSSESNLKPDLREELTGETLSRCHTYLSILSSAANRFKRRAYRGDVIKVPHLSEYFEFSC